MGRARKASGLTRMIRPMHRPRAGFARAAGMACVAGVAGTLMLTACSVPDEAATGSAMSTPPSVPEITGNNAFFYYADLPAATRFYEETLGLPIVADYDFAKILQIANTSFLTLVDAEMGMHSADEPKTVAIALVTDQLDAWYDYLTAAGVEMRYGYNPTEGSAHDGFVAVDPEGYYLEFERFNPHEENADFIPLLEKAPTLATRPDMGFKATVLWLYYKDLSAAQRFYETHIGLDLLVDQGWAKIYQTSPTGFIGLVDQSRGMHSFTEQKGVTVSFLTADTKDLETWFAHAADGAFELRSETISTDNPRYRAFVGYDPEGYYLEFDTFLPHPDNKQLLQRIR